MAGFAMNRSRQVPAEETPAFGGIAERFRRAGDLDRAIALCHDGLRRFPNQLSARVTLGWAFLDKGQYAEAQAEFEKVLRRAPDNLAAIRGMAELHERAESAMPSMESAHWQHHAEGSDAAHESTGETTISHAASPVELASPAVDVDLATMAPAPTAFAIGATTEKADPQSTLGSPTELNSGQAEVPAFLNAQGQAIALGSTAEPVPVAVDRASASSVAPFEPAAFVAEAPPERAPTAAELSSTIGETFDPTAGVGADFDPVSLALDPSNEDATAEASRPTLEGAAPFVLAAETLGASEDSSDLQALVAELLPDGEAEAVFEGVGDDAPVVTVGTVTLPYEAPLEVERSFEVEQAPQALTVHETAEPTPSIPEKADEAVVLFAEAVAEPLGTGIAGEAPEAAAVVVAPADEVVPPVVSEGPGIEVEAASVAAEVAIVDEGAESAAAAALPVVEDVPAAVAVAAFAEVEVLPAVNAVPERSEPLASTIASFVRWNAAAEDQPGAVSEAAQAPALSRASAATLEPIGSTVVEMAPRATIKARRIAALERFLRRIEARRLQLTSGSVA
jgi:hypothetical protein